MFKIIIRTSKHLIKSLIGAVTYPYYQLSYYKRTVKKFVPVNGRYAVVNLDRQLTADDYSRYFYSICMYFSNAGFKVVVKSYVRDFRNIRKVGFQENIWNENYVFVRTCSTPINSVTLVTAGSPDHVIQFYYGYNILRRGIYDCIAPYPMHPNQYKSYLDPRFHDELKKSKRTMKISFSGKAKQSMYADVRVKTFFNVMSRLAVLRFIVAEYSERTRHLKNKSDKLILEEIFNSDIKTNEIIISEVKTDEKDWLKFLWKSDFFICPPGARMPWSHNSVEAMSAGAIPILEYGSLFHPALEHRKNCLCYTNFDELKSAIDMALSMDTGEIALMRKNVFDYYTQYLSGDSITRRINEFYSSPNQLLKVAIPFVPTFKEWRSIPWLG
jgi:hypothetical protein